VTTTPAFIGGRIVTGGRGALQTGFVAGAIITGDTLVVGGLDGALYGFPAS
jgi:hypothetical protein